MKRKKLASRGRKEGSVPSGSGIKSSQMKAYGDRASICANAECVMRRKAKCFGFEGCPGYIGK